MYYFIFSIEMFSYVCFRNHTLLKYFFYLRKKSPLAVLQSTTSGSGTPFAKHRNKQLHVPHLCASGVQAESAALSPGNRATFAFPRKPKKIPAALKEVTVVLL